MLTRRERLRGISTPAEFSTANASFLPFPDRTFDAVFSFGGLGVFGDAGQALREIVRVAKVGARWWSGTRACRPGFATPNTGESSATTTTCSRKRFPSKTFRGGARRGAALGHRQRLYLLGSGWGKGS